ncbi:MAG TPA: hypothetical protein VIA10_16975 [Gaiellaceae bacterium]
MRPLLAAAAVLAALAAAPSASASSPVPWCGVADGSDRLPDATPGFAVHVVYVRPADEPDRLEAWAPRLVGDVAAIDAWWRRQDPARALRFDLFALGCSTTLGQLDITNVIVPRGPGTLPEAFSTLRFQLAARGFAQAEKIYLVYYDGAVGQPDGGEICGAGDTPSAGLSGVAIVFLSACEAESSDVYRPVVAAHELVHALGAVAGAAPHHCDAGHVCDDPDDLLNSALTGKELEAHVLDRNRDDYYGHSGAWPNVRDSRFLERLDSPDRTPPSNPAALSATDGAALGLVRLSWRASADDVGPVTYRIYQDDRFVDSTGSTSALLGIAETDTSTYAVRATDAVGHLSQPVSIRFQAGVGVIDLDGRLVRDTVRPPAVSRVVVRKTARTVVLTWPAVRDAGGLRHYRVTIVGRRTFTVTRPRVTLVRAGLRGAVSVAAIDRGGNVGPSTVVPLRRLR